MLSTKDIIELEKKYSTYIFKKRFKLSLYIIFILFVIFSILFYIFYLKTVQSPKSIDGNMSEKKVEKIVKLSSIEDTGKTKKQDKNMSEKNSNFSSPKEINRTNTIIKDQNTISTAKFFKSQNEEHNLSSKINHIDINTSKNTKKNFIFNLSPSARLGTNHKTAGKLNLIIPIISQKNSIANKSNFDKNSNKNDTITNNVIKKPKINIEMKDIDSIKYLKDKFRKTHDIVFALMLCENYYNQKDFKKSLKWSIIANDIDSQSERSWIWFAKSKYRLNQKNDAIKALKAFLRTNDSQKIKSLLNDIINGVVDD